MPGPRSGIAQAWQDPFLRFLIVAVSLYVGWLLVYEQFLHPWGGLDRTVINGLVWAASGLLTSLGYEMLPEPRIDLERYIGVQGGSHLWIGDACNGVTLFAAFSIFITAFPGPWRHKAWFIPLGILVIHVLNAVRVAALCIVVTYSYEWLSFNHDYTFYVVVYGCVFALWFLWVTRFSGWRRSNAA